MIDLPFNPDYTAHPGELAEMFMEDVGIDSAELARRMGVAIQFVERLLAAEEDFAVGLSTAQKLGKAFGMPRQFWLNAEAGYREDLIRVTPKRVGLFDDWESFFKVECDHGNPMATNFREELLVKIGIDERVATALRNVDNYLILAEYYEGRVFFEFKIGHGKGVCMAFGPKLLLISMAKWGNMNLSGHQRSKGAHRRLSYDYSYSHV